MPAANLAYYDASAGWIVEPGDYEVIAARHALDDGALRARLVIHWHPRRVRPSVPPRLPL